MKVNRKNPNHVHSVSWESAALHQKARARARNLGLKSLSNYVNVLVKKDLAAAEGVPEEDEVLLLAQDLARAALKHWSKKG